MTDNVINIGGQTTQDLRADQVLDGANKSNLATAIVVGYEKNGNLYFAATTSDVEHVLYALEKAKHKMLSGDYGDDN